jgi:hypothetical protein
MLIIDPGSFSIQLKIRVSESPIIGESIGEMALNNYTPGKPFALD